ncbi:MAG TPA: PAS domain S-box protein, partial [Sediminibacterium sp.]|nr:PAS domain S-box protein [Sediminibacterium sp.]
MDIYATIIKHSNDAIISKNLDGIIMSWNPAAEIIFGYSEQEAIGHHISLVIPPDKMHEEPVFIQALREGRRIEHYETSRIRKDGTRIEVSITLSPMKDDNGTIIGGSKIVRDVTARKIAEQRVVESEARLRSTLDRMLEGVQILNHGFQYLYVNE